VNAVRTTRQEARDVAAVEAACARGYVVVVGLDSSAGTIWLQRCRRNGWPYLAVYPSEPTFTVDLSYCRPDLDAVRAVYRRHGVRENTANPYRYDHAFRRRRAEPLARDLWLAITGEEKPPC
jgi:hypothetical protein